MVGVFRFDGGHLVVRADFAFYDCDVVPCRLYVGVRDTVSVGHYVEYEKEDGSRNRVVIHNIYKLKELADYYGLSLPEAIVVNELHELTHYAQTEEERKETDVTHSFRWNRVLAEVVKYSRQADQ